MAAACLSGPQMIGPAQDLAARRLDLQLAFGPMALYYIPLRERGDEKDIERRIDTYIRSISEPTVYSLSSYLLVAATTGLYSRCLVFSWGVPPDPRSRCARGHLVPGSEYTRLCTITSSEARPGVRGEPPGKFLEEKMKR